VYNNLAIIESIKCDEGHPASGTRQHQYFLRLFRARVDDTSFMPFIALAASHDLHIQFGFKFYLPDVFIVSGVAAPLSRKLIETPELSR